jgi:nucleoside 2-deoxyribosyltransferase
MPDTISDGSAIEKSTTPKEFLDVFVVRSFRESHLDPTIIQLRKFIQEYDSTLWNCKPYRLVNTSRDISSSGILCEEIMKKIKNSAITVVILDGLRHNVLFELGFLYALRKPFILLKHRRWGPSFMELDQFVSDIKGIVVKEYDDEKETDLFEMLKDEFLRCEKQFVEMLGTHLVVPASDENLVIEPGWNFDSVATIKGDPAYKTKTENRESIKLPSFNAADLPISRHISATSLFVVEFNLENVDSGFTAYLHVLFEKNGKLEGVWFGYSTNTVSPYLVHKDDHVEVSIPSIASGAGAYILVDNIRSMIMQRLGTDEPGLVIVDRIRLRGSLYEKGSPAEVTKVLITQ